MITRIATAAVYVESQDDAAKFWTDQVGFEVRRRQNMGPAGDWLEVGPGPDASCIVVYPKYLMDIGRNESRPSYSSAKTCMPRLRRCAPGGVEFSQEPTEMAWGPSAIFNDPEGNWFGHRQSG